MYPRADNAVQIVWGPGIPTDVFADDTSGRFLACSGYEAITLTFQVDVRRSATRIDLRLFLASTDGATGQVLPWAPYTEGINTDDSGVLVSAQLVKEWRWTVSSADTDPFTRVAILPTAGAGRFKVQARIGVGYNPGTPAQFTLYASRFIPSGMGE